MMCRAADLESKIIVGFSKTENKHIGIYQRADHAWNAVKIDGDWKLVDVTWASGYVDEGQFYRAFQKHYFLTDPDKFIVNHLPTDPRWRLTQREMNLTDFHNLPLFYPNYFTDSLELTSASWNGVIEVEPDETFQIQFESADKVQSVYMSEDLKEGKFSALLFREESSMYTADLCFRKKGSRFVTIIVDSKPMWTYRVMVR